MKNVIVIAPPMADIFNDGWELQVFPAPGLTPGFKLP
jgi:hypothetical protein